MAIRAVIWNANALLGIHDAELAVRLLVERRISSVIRCREDDPVVPLQQYGQMGFFVDVHLDVGVEGLSPERLPCLVSIHCPAAS